MRVLLVTLVSLASACGVDVVVGASETADAGASGSTSSADSIGTSVASTGGADSGGVSTTSTGGEATDPTGVGTTVGIRDLGSFPPACDPIGQDCGAGSGCYFIDGIYTCRPPGGGTDADPCDQPDDCEAGLHCGSEGTCVPYCDPDDITACEAGACVPLENLEWAGACGPPEDCSVDPSSVEFEGECYPSCDPLEQDCPDEDACFPAPSMDAFICAAPGEVGDGQACEYINSCMMGLTCVDGSSLPGSPSPGGCTPYCSVSAPDCAVGLECAPYFPEGEEPPGYEDVGVCVEV